MRFLCPRIFTACFAAATLGCQITGAGLTEHLPRWRPERQASEQARAYAHYLSSIIYDRGGEHDRALDEMAKVPDLDPDAITPTLRMIRAYTQQQEFDEALPLAEQALEKEPDSPELWILLGHIRQQLEQYDEAMAAFKRATQLAPDALLGYGALVKLQEATNDLAGAVDAYERLIELSPESAGLHFQLGVLLIRIDDKQRAQEVLERALALNPQLSRARFFLGTLYLESEAPHAAIAHLEHYRRGHPDDLNAAENLAGAYARAGRFDEAAKLYDELTASENALPHHFLQAMYVLLRAGEPSRAEKAAPAVGAPHLTTLLTAVARKQQEQPYEPLVASLDALDADLEDEINAVLNRLFYLFGADDFGGWLIEQINALQPEDGQSRKLAMLEARTLLQQEKPGEAIEIFERLAQEEETPDLHYWLAVVNDELENFAETERHLKAYLEANSNDPEVMNFLGYLYAEEGVKLEEAERLLNQALELDPDNPFYLDSLGWVYYRQGKAEQAIQLIQRAIYGMESDDAVLRDHLGDAYLLAGEKKKAVDQWRRALRLDATLEGVQEKIEAHTPLNQ